MGNKQNEFIEKLYERLMWITFEAPEEEVDVEEIKNIVEQLDELEPWEEDPHDDVEKALQRFKERYGLSDEDLRK